MPLMIVVTLALLAYAMPRIAGRLACDLGMGSYAPGALTLGLGTALFLAPVVVVGNIFGSTTAGNVASLLVSAALAVFAWRRRPGPIPKPIERGSRLGFYLASVVALIVVADLALRYQMHDELILLGHETITAQLERGVLPPYITWAPGELLRYHWGFDLVAATFGRILPISVSMSLDVAAIYLAVLWCWTAAAVVEAMGGWAPAGVWAVFFSAGFAVWRFLSFENPDLGCMNQFYGCHTLFFHGQLTYFFQHAISLGLPMFLVYALLAPHLHRVREVPALGWVIPPLLLTLAVGHVVFFVLGVLSAVTAAVLWWRGPNRRGHPVLWGFSLLGVFSGVLAGTVLTQTSSYDAGALVFKPDFMVWPSTWHEQLAFWLTNLGLGFVLLPLFIWESLRRRVPVVVMLTSFAVGGILVPMLFKWGRSWDILKFPSASAYALSLLAVGVGYTKLRRPGAAWRGARALFWVALVSTGVLNTVTFLWPTRLKTDRLPPIFTPRWTHVDRVARWLRAGRYQTEQLILAGDYGGNAYLAMNGLSVGYVSDWAMSHGFTEEVVGPFKELYLTVRSGLDAQQLKRAGVRWVLTSGADEAAMSPEARARLYDAGHFKLVRVFPSAAPNKALKLWWNLSFPLPEAVSAAIEPASAAR